jgi:DNA-binding protein HU-beta
MATGKSAGKKLTKSQLAAELAEVTATSKKTAAQFLDTLCSIAYRETKKVGEFTIPGIGKLVKQNRKARTGRNPATGEPIKIPAKIVAKFRLAKAAKDSVLSSKK